MGKMIKLIRLSLSNLLIDGHHTLHMLLFITTSTDENMVLYDK